MNRTHLLELAQRLTYESDFDAQEQAATILRKIAQSQPVAWMDDFGNAFPLAAHKGSGSWLDEHKRDWKPLYNLPVEN